MRVAPKSPKFVASFILLSLLASFALENPVVAAISTFTTPGGISNAVIVAAPRALSTFPQRNEKSSSGRRASEWNCFAGVIMRNPGVNSNKSRFLFRSRVASAYLVSSNFNPTSTSTRFITAIESRNDGERSRRRYARLSFIGTFR